MFNYFRIFCRDAHILSMGMVVSGDPLLREGAMAGLEFLARRKAENGQIPDFVGPEIGETDFRYLGCIGTTLCWLAAVGQGAEAVDALARAARMYSVDGLAIHEWFHGRTGEPSGGPEPPSPPPRREGGRR